MINFKKISNKIKNFYLNYSAKRKGYRLTLIDPENLNGKYLSDNLDSSNSSKYSTSNRYSTRKSELTPYVNGRKVKYWRLVNVHGFNENTYIPIFYKRRRFKR